MEGLTLLCLSLFASAKSAEVFRRLGSVIEELYDNSAFFKTINSDVKEDFRVLALL